jgi:hypothetical protein
MGGIKAARMEKLILETDMSQIEIYLLHLEVSA